MRAMLATLGVRGSAVGGGLGRTTQVAVGFEVHVGLGDAAGAEGSAVAEGLGLVGSGVRTACEAVRVPPPQAVKDTRNAPTKTSVRRRFLNELSLCVPLNPTSQHRGPPEQGA